MSAPISARVVRLVASSRVVLAFLVLSSTWTGTAAFGQALLWTRPAATQPASNLALAGPMGQASSPSKPATFSPTLTILLDPASCTATELAAFGPDLSRWLQSSNGGTAQLIVLSVDNEPAVVTVKTAEEATAALQKLSAPATNFRPIPMDALIAYLRGTPIHPEWRQYVYAGAQPAVAAETRDYTVALLTRILIERRVRFSQLRAADSVSDWNAALEAVSGSSGPRLADLIDRSNRDWFEVAMPTWAPPVGYRLAKLDVSVDPAQHRNIPYVWGDLAKLPAPAAYADTLKLRAATVISINAPATLPGDGLAQLERLVSQNPDDLDVLKLAADYSDHVHNSSQAAVYANAIVARDPSNGLYWAKLGVYQSQNGAGDQAEAALLKARELGVDQLESARILGDLHVARKDYAGAELQYQDAARREPNRAEIRLALADVHKQLNRPDAMTQDLEQALKISPDLWDRRIQIVNLYLDRSDKTDALRQVQAGTAALPADAKLCEQYAALYERLDQPDQAIKLWSRSIELESSPEPSYFALVSLHTQMKNWNLALTTANAGVEAVPQSGRLQALRVQALLALGKTDEARQSLRSVAEKSSAPDLLTEAASLEDKFGVQSASYYRSLVEAARDRSAPESEWKPLAQQGLRASLRSRQGDICEWFAQALASNLCKPSLPADEAHATIAGGYIALLFMAHGPAKSSPEAAMLDYAAALNANYVYGTDAGKKVSDAYYAHLTEYFDLLSDLKALGKKDGAYTTVRLSLEDKQTSAATERILSLLGWQTRVEKGKRIVENATKGKKSKRQDLASALAIDVVGMQDNLQAGKEFLLDIPDEAVTLFPQESAWEEQFYKGKKFPGGFAEALARNHAMSVLYAAISNMERGSARVLVSTIGMKSLAENYADLLAIYSPCLELSDGTVRVPGGAAANAVWAALVGQQPTNPGPFVRALLDKDRGSLLKFYFMISQLDSSRQRFFTASSKRADAFYKAFRDSDQIAGRTARTFGSASIQSLFRELPINTDGKLEFPGSPEVWMVAKTNSSSVQKTQNRLDRIARVTTPDVEDEILLRLLKTDYKDGGTKYEEWQNLLAVVRVDAGRPEPLDPASALILAEKFAGHEGLYGYFVRFAGLKADHYREVFTFAEKLERMGWGDANLASGIFQSGFYLLGTVEQSGRLKPDQSAALLLDFTKALNLAKGDPELARAALDFLESLEKALGMSGARSLRDALVAKIGNDPVRLDADHTVAPLEMFQKRFDKILELQKVPALDQLLLTHQSLRTMASGKGDLNAAGNALLKSIQTFKDVELPKKSDLRPDQIALIRSGSVTNFALLDKDLQKLLTNKKPDPKKVQALADKYWEPLAFRTMIALAGQVYAAYLNPTDLLITEDPLLLRKHSFVVIQGRDKIFFPSGELYTSNVAGGSYLTGTFAGISSMAGQIAAGGLRNVDATTAYVAAALLGSVRTTDWSKVNGDVVRAAGLQIHSAEDWLVLAATDVPLRDAVADSTYGLLSLNRRARLLAGLQQHDWNTVWASMSRTDLFFLASRLRRSPAASAQHTPAIDAYRALPDATLRAVRVLGSSLPVLHRSPGPDLFELAPYEEAAGEQFPNYLGERVAEFKLYLVDWILDQAMSPAILPVITETSAGRVLGNIQMTSLHDWQAVLDAYENFDSTDLGIVMAAK